MKRRHFLGGALGVALWRGGRRSPTCAVVPCLRKRLRRTMNLGGHRSHPTRRSQE